MESVPSDRSTCIMGNIVHHDAYPRVDYNNVECLQQYVDGIQEHFRITANERLRRLGVRMRIAGPPAEDVSGVGDGQYRVAL